ncbi:hypothetical protein [Vibrio owensii]|uniref:hypothetical protein n=1 Tax=Vibrio owensii TaxID=696485 RepID=UPI003CC66038
MTLTTHLVMLTCESEHEVPIEYSEDTTKGYILRDEQGRECHNQYPTASYGQIDTSADYRASMFDRENEELLCYTRIDNAYESIMRMESKHPDLVNDELRDIKAQILKFMEDNNLKFEESDFMKQYHGAVFSYNIVEVSKGDS